jgi:hypothetical protein
MTLTTPMAPNSQSQRLSAASQPTVLSQLPPKPRHVQWVFLYPWRFFQRCFEGVFSLLAPSITAMCSSSGNRQTGDTGL